MDYSISISRSATLFAADRDGALVSQEHICDSRKFVSKHVYPVTGPYSADVRGRRVSV